MPDANGSAVATLAASIEAAFERIRTDRMQGVPILNPRLTVAVVGLRPHGEAWLGALVTPWFINLLLLPRSVESQSAWPALLPGTSCAHDFPAGRFEFLVGSEPGVGTFQMCSLFSPVLEFEDQSAARIAADAALSALFEAERAEPPAPPPSTALAGEAACREDLSRRGFLRLTRQETP